MGIDNGIRGKYLGCSEPLFCESQDGSNYPNNQPTHEEHETGQANFQSLEIGLRGQMLELRTKFRFQNGHTLF